MRNIRSRRREGRAAQASTAVDLRDCFERDVVDDAHAHSIPEHADRGTVSNIRDSDEPVTSLA